MGKLEVWLGRLGAEFVDNIHNGDRKGFWPKSPWREGR